MKAKAVARIGVEGLTSQTELTELVKFSFMCHMNAETSFVEDPPTITVEMQHRKGRDLLDVAVSVILADAVTRDIPPRQVLDEALADMQERGAPINVKPSDFMPIGEGE